jgi:hypothetical protein
MVANKLESPFSPAKVSKVKETLSRSLISLDLMEINIDNSDELSPGSSFLLFQLALR